MAENFIVKQREFISQLREKIHIEILKVDLNIVNQNMTKPQAFQQYGKKKGNE